MQKIKSMAWKNSRSMRSAHAVLEVYVACMTVLNRNWSWNAENIALNLDTLSSWHRHQLQKQKNEQV